MFQKKLILKNIGLNTGNAMRPIKTTFIALHFENTLGINNFFAHENFTS